MKIFKHLFFVALTLVFFGGCQKELNFDGEASRGSLKSTLTGDCNPININGYYQEDSLLNADNWVEVQINTNFAGNFDIKSDTVNGFSFSRAGFVQAGLNTIRLLSSGKPDTAIATTFTVFYDTTFCEFTINVVASTAGAAHYVLGGSPGACASFTKYGTYTVGTPLDAADSVTFLVNVTTPGNYNITTGSFVNGMKFSGAGTFANIGIQQVALYGTGTPTNNTTANFVVTGDGTTCTFSITPGGGTGTASFTFTGGPAPGTCSGAVVNGTYTAGNTVTASNTVNVFVNVTALGTYGITTGAVNGVTFSKSGTFTSLTPNPQMVTLIASGTPTAAGTFNYTPSSGSTSCVFSVIFNTGSTNADYIPQTIRSNWSDKLVGGMASDTSYIEVSPRTTVQGGNTYSVFTIDDGSGLMDSTYHRKGAGKYYEYIYNDFGVFDNPVNQELLLIDSTLAANGTWSTSFLGNTIGGSSADLRIDAKIIAKGLTKVVAGNTYTNVIEVRFTYYLNFMGFGYQHVADEEFFYAKGKGLIDDIQTDFPVTTTTEYQTTRVQIF